MQNNSKLVYILIAIIIILLGVIIYFFSTSRQQSQYSTPTFTTQNNAPSPNSAVSNSSGTRATDTTVNTINQGTGNTPSSPSNSSSQTLVILTPSLPNGNIGQPYSQTLQATGGTAPYIWAVKNIKSSYGTPGLSLSSSGVLKGTPTTVSSWYGLDAVVTDSAGHTATKTFTFMVLPQGASSTLAISTTSLPDGIVGQSYSATLQATGGTAPYTWTPAASLCHSSSGLSISSSGIVSGTPTMAMPKCSFNAIVTDSTGARVSKPFSFTIK